MARLGLIACLGAWAWLAGLLAGCQAVGTLRLVADDQIVQPGQTVQPRFRLIRSGWSKYFPPSNPPAVAIYRDNQLLDQVRPAGANVVSTPVTIDAPGEHVIDAVYQPQPGRAALHAVSYTYCWDQSRVGVAIDLDRVINQMSRLEEWTLELPLNQARDQAPEVVAALADDFYVCYLTEISQEDKAQVRKWLADHRLPLGPVITWDRGSRARLRPGNQAAVLERLRRAVPILLIGIGDGNDDVGAFVRNGMLAITINYQGGIRSTPDAPRLFNWNDVWQFVSLPRNRAILTNPKTMLDLHYAGGNYVGGE